MRGLRWLCRRWFAPLPPPTQEEQDKAKEELFVRVAKLKKLLASPEWREYAALVETYIERCLMQKLRYNFAHAYQVQDEKTFRHAAFLDNDVDFARRLLGLPQELIDDVERAERSEGAGEEEPQEMVA